MEPAVNAPRWADLSQDPTPFWQLLPADWQEDIVPHWPLYCENTEVYGLYQGSRLVVGGLVFSQVSPDTKVYASLAQSWLDRGYAYIGFVFVDEAYRGQGWGQRWMKGLLSQQPKGKFWLTVEEAKLTRFYQRFGFHEVQEIAVPGGVEWLMAREL